MNSIDTTPSELPSHSDVELQFNPNYDETFSVFTFFRRQTAAFLFNLIQPTSSIARHPLPLQHQHQHKQRKSKETLEDGKRDR